MHLSCAFTLVGDLKELKARLELADWVEMVVKLNTPRCSVDLLLQVAE